MLVGLKSLPKPVRTPTKGKTVGGPITVQYSTTFGSTEDPISEGGAWVKNASNQWAQVRTIGGNALGSQGIAPNSGNDFNDSYTINYAKSWGSDYELDAIIFRDPSISTANHEVELNGRFVDDADSVRGYEVLLNKDGAIQAFRWNDAFGSFSPTLTPTGSDSVGSVPDGARFKVRYQGDTISVYYSSDGSEPTLRCTFNINEVGSPKYNDGNPAIAFFCRPAADGSNPAHFGFKSVTITKL